MPATTPAPHRISPRSRLLGWLAIGLLAILFAGLAVASSHAPTVKAAGNPLYLHGTGTAPGCAASTFDATAGSRTTACSIQSQSGGVTTTWAWTSLPAQTVAAGVWSFNFYWTGGTGATNDLVSIAAGVSATSSCAGFVATIPNTPSTWSASYGANTANTTSPLTVTTSASQLALVIPPGGSLCLSVTLTHNTGGKPSMLYDGTAAAGATNFVPPSIVVPEGLLGLVGLAAVVPFVAGRFVRRRRA